MYSSGADIVWSHVPHSPPSICIHIYLLYCIESYRHIYWLQLRKGWGMVKGRGVRGIKMDHDKRTFFRFFTYLWVFHKSVFFVIFLVHNVHTYGTWQVFCIENWNTVQLFNIFSSLGIWRSFAKNLNLCVQTERK